MRRTLSNTAGVLLGALMLLSGGTSFAGWADKIDEWYSPPTKSMEYQTVEETSEVEYKNIIDLDGYVAALEDSRADIENIREMMSSDKYSAAIESPAEPEVAYQNRLTVQRYIASLAKRTDDLAAQKALQQFVFKNTMTLNRYIANLADPCKWDVSTPELFVVAQCEMR